MNLYGIKFHVLSQYNTIISENNIKSYRKVCIDEVKKRYRPNIETFGYTALYNNLFDYVIDIDFKNEKNTNKYMEKFNMLTSCLKPALRNIAINKIL